MSSAPETSTPDPRPGHHWKDPDRVKDYVARMDRRAAERQDQLALLARLIPFPLDTPLNVLDLGAGYGAVAAAVLERYPQARTVLLDISDAMAAQGEERLSAYKGRYEYVLAGFDGGQIPQPVTGTFHAVVSSLAIHHLSPEDKRSLYSAVAERLLPGGCFLNLDIVAAPDEAGEALYRRIEEEERQARGEPPWPSTTTQHQHSENRQQHSELQPLAQHLAWLQEAGLTGVDCFYKRLGTALFGGLRPS